MGFEPMTSCLLDRRSNQLSYGASWFVVSALFIYIIGLGVKLYGPQIDIGISYSNISEFPRNILINLFSSCLVSCE